MSKDKKEYSTLLEEAGHKLIRTEEGDIDIWQLDVEYHNGPRCEKCHTSWCHHCRDTIRPCTVP